MSSLMATLRASVIGAKASEDEDKDYMEDEENTASEDEPEAEGDEPEAEDEPEGEEDEPEAGDDDPEAEDEEETPAARNAASRARMGERKRILAILTHPNAEAQPALAARMISDGTSAAKASGLLDAVQAGPAAKPALAQRVASFNRGRKPGRDGAAASTGKSDNRLLATVQAARATRKKGA